MISEQYEKILDELEEKIDLTTRAINDVSEIERTDGDPNGVLAQVREGYENRLFELGQMWDNIHSEFLPKSKYKPLLLKKKPDVQM